MADWLDNLRIAADPIGLSRRVPALPEYSSPLDVGANYLVRGLFGAADLAKLPIAAAAQVPDASSALFNWATTKTNAEGQPLETLRAATTTAEKALQPPQAEVDKKAAEIVAQKEAAKKNQMAQIDQALLNSVPGPSSKAAGKNIPAPEAPKLAEQPQAAPESEADLSKAMLRAGIAMLKSDGDIWDAIGAGFGGYQSSLEEQEAKKIAAAKEARDSDLEKYKADLYAAQVMFPYWKAERGGDAGDWKASVAERRLALQEQKQAEADRLNLLKTKIDIQDKIDTAPDLATKNKYLQLLYEASGAGGNPDISGAMAKGFRANGATVPVLPLK